MFFIILLVLILFDPGDSYLQKILSNKVQILAGKGFKLPHDLQLLIKMLLINVATLNVMAVKVCIQLMLYYLGIHEALSTRSAVTSICN